MWGGGGNDRAILVNGTTKEKTSTIAVKSFLYESCIRLGMVTCLQVEVGENLWGKMMTAEISQQSKLDKKLGKPGPFFT